jgi:iron complex transport system substrate-binding protein
MTVPWARIREMRRAFIAFALHSFLVIAAVSFLGACDRQKQASPQPSTSAKSPRVVSLVPTASDIIEEIGAGDHLVAVSNYDVDPRTTSLPHVGDYLTTDWERIVPLQPQVIITQYAPGRTPEGFSQRLTALGATQVNIKVDRLDDIYGTILQLADACGEHQKGIDARKKLQETIDAVRKRVANEPPVAALIVLGPDANSAAGSDTFFDDVLSAAGGKNVVAGMGMYPSLDREQLLTRQPQVIIQLLPMAGPQVIEQAKASWQSMPQLPAVKNGRVVRLTEWYVMHSGYEVGTLAQRFAEILHPNLTTQSTQASTHPSTAPPSSPRP